MTPQEAEREGQYAYARGVGRDLNPYRFEILRDAWDKGWCEAAEQDDERRLGRQAGMDDDLTQGP